MKFGEECSPLLHFFHSAGKGTKKSKQGKGHKKRAPLSPTFVNLKSNTMKNTVQRYGLLRNLQNIQAKKYVL